MTGRAGVLNVSEIFGPTVQGEGPAVGRAAVFLRLAGCHVRCAWCDTRYSWDPETPGPSPERLFAGDVALRLHRAAAAPGTVVVITGGEPLLQQRPLIELLRHADMARLEVHLETSGTVLPDPALLARLAAVVVSPKLAHSVVPAHVRLDDRALAAFAAVPHATFKFVVTGPADLDEVAVLVDRHGMRNVAVMAEGTTAEEVLATSRAVAHGTVRRGWSLTPRWHILLWGDQPGR